MASKKLKGGNIKLTPKKRQIFGIGSVIVLVLFILSTLPALVMYLGKAFGSSDSKIAESVEMIQPVADMAEKLLSPAFFTLLGIVGLFFLAIPMLKVLGIVLVLFSAISLYAVITTYLKTKK